MRIKFSKRGSSIFGWQLLLIAAFLLAWQYLPEWSFAREHVRFLDPVFISSPVEVWKELYNQTFPKTGPTIWSYARPTIVASVIGTAIGVVVGLAVGVVLGNSDYLSRVFRPFAVALNAVPRIALIPLFLIAFGPSFVGTAAVCFAVVFFIAFFNAYEGASSVAQESIDNVRLLGGSAWQVLLRVRTPYAAAWTFAALPLAVTFALITAVTAEVLVGSRGMGRLLLQSLQTGQTSLTFAVAIVLSLVGLVAVWLLELARKRLLHWWQPSG